MVEISHFTNVTVEIVPRNHVINNGTDKLQIQTVLFWIRTPNTRMHAGTHTPHARTHACTRTHRHYFMNNNTWSVLQVNSFLLAYFAKWKSQILCVGPMYHFFETCLLMVGSLLLRRCCLAREPQGYCWLHCPALGLHITLLHPAGFCCCCLFVLSLEASYRSTTSGPALQFGHPSQLHWCVWGRFRSTLWMCHPCFLTATPMAPAPWGLPNCLAPFACLILTPGLLCLVLLEGPFSVSSSPAQS